MQPFKRAWISGGTRGIGLGLARAVLNHNPESRVWVSSRNGAESTEAQGLLDEFGDRVMCERMDITDITSVDATAEKIAAEADKKLDLVINTVGILHEGDKGPERRLRDVDPEWSVYNYKVNALGPLLLARALIEGKAFNNDRLCCLANISAKVGSIADNRMAPGTAIEEVKLRKINSINALRLKSADSDALLFALVCIPELWTLNSPSHFPKVYLMKSFL
eukprot:CAMPEP_0171498928 /NCGR_PEP_ID=MMETSP0958-20121227/8129_1 /TAXON_ID=87120 /ORGANISM="Aurantiochytrium limacinum, Strain ATCCMYA-1381" /LENGTH=220 /DNA_ID=CAMNT_0012033395 /DNA_START=376 /DNA_END=1039 /DNA_ORIENTATION=+